MKRIIKDNTQILIGFIIGAIVFTGLSSLVAYAIGANEVSFTPTDTNWKVNDTTVGDVKTALDDLYAKANDAIDTYQGVECPGCVFRLSTDNNKCTVDATWPDCTNGTYTHTLSSSEYTTDYKSLNSNYFLGYVLGDDDGNGNKPILAHYACGLVKNKLYCFRGYVGQDETSLTYKPNYYERINKINVIEPTCNATYIGNYQQCSASGTWLIAYVFGTSAVRYGISGCAAHSSGWSTCEIN